MKNLIKQADASGFSLWYPRVEFEFQIFVLCSDVFGLKKEEVILEYFLSGWFLWLLVMFGGVLGASKLLSLSLFTSHLFEVT
ncbi:hypothetical protein L1987_82722 [Smallanthus sonchifolius]|uniref:Uncharacterized protein n=1 Tax=Smallanthus sonchifolius TaxID=185202 RepID=A0ACB8YB51_9ASTR|nr:hypothetical protein L1987_82722 [Smallanthus sonchifolius]